jgi:peptide/nickel transport system ATP-binding protein
MMKTRRDRTTQDRPAGMATASSASTAVLEVDGLTVTLNNGTPLVQDVSFSVAPREIFGLAGESGSGKSTAALALLGFALPGVRITAGSVRVAGTELIGPPERAVRRLRGKLISYVPQDPSGAMNPSMRVGAAIGTLLGDLAGEKRLVAVREALERVDLPSDDAFLRRYPHQLSGGQRQRVAIAAATVANPALVVMDEPTTGLDVITQAYVLEEVRRLRDRMDVAIVYITHDLHVMRAIADRITVMYAGMVVESGPCEDVLRAPRHPYTRGLVAAIPDHRVRRVPARLPGSAAAPGEIQEGCPFAPRCSQRVEACVADVPPLLNVGPGRHARCIEWQRTPSPDAGTAVAAVDEQPPGEALLSVRELVMAYPGRHAEPVLHRVDLDVREGERVGVVGQSGSGKSSLARCIVGLADPQSGTLKFRGSRLPWHAEDRERDQLRAVQIVFQNPTDSLNPRRTVADLIGRPMHRLLGSSRDEIAREIPRLLELVQLPAAVAERRPIELSGGGRQRVAIAQALAVRPALLICDEITSALDVSVQGAVINVLNEIHVELRTSMLFITHDLGVVSTVADRVIVMQEGRIVEQGTTPQILDEPGHDYTSGLLRAADELSVGRPPGIAGSAPRSAG